MRYPYQDVYYYAIYRTEEKTPPAGGLMCVEATSGPLQVVLWNHRTRTWQSNSNAGARFLFNDDKVDRRREVSRVEAERIAREELGTELPSEEELHRIVLAGEAAETE